jgi:hypothetical protein
VIALLTGIAYARTYIPFFGVIRLLVPALAPFEVKWLFVAKEISKLEGAEPAFFDERPNATAEDHEAFREYLKQQHRPFRKSGRSLDEEFVLWLADRARKQAEAGAKAAVR